jgi:hypothetical protein
VGFFCGRQEIALSKVDTVDNKDVEPLRGFKSDGTLWQSCLQAKGFACAGVRHRFFFFGHG